MNDYRCGSCAKLFSVPEYAACPRCGDTGVYVGDLLHRRRVANLAASALAEVVRERSTTHASGKVFTFEP